jgi:hypothetical protein
LRRRLSVAVLSRRRLAAGTASRETRVVSAGGPRRGRACGAAAFPTVRAADRRTPAAPRARFVRRQRI